jgi:hypothetical protein
MQHICRKADRIASSDLFIPINLAFFGTVVLDQFVIP